MRRTREWERGYQAALDDMQGRARPGSPCRICGEPIPLSKGGPTRAQCSRECTVAAAHAREKLKRIQGAK